MEVIMPKVRKQQDGLNLTLQDSIRLGHATESKDYHLVMSMLEEFKDRMNWITTHFQDNYKKWKHNYENYTEEHWYDLKMIQQPLHDLICKHLLNKR